MAIPMSPVKLKKLQCCMSLSIIYAYVAFQIYEMTMSNVVIYFGPLSHVTQPLWILRKGRVTVSNLGDEGHT